METLGTEIRPDLIRRRLPLVAAESFCGQTSRQAGKRPTSWSAARSIGCRHAPADLLRPARPNLGDGVGPVSPQRGEHDDGVSEGHGGRDSDDGHVRMLLWCRHRHRG
jgi:hypothetical protein